MRDGDYRVICDRSGFKAWRSECRMEWDGKLVLKKFWRRRNPLDFPPPVIQQEPLQNPRPESDYYFVGINEVKAGDI